MKIRKNWKLKWKENDPFILKDYWLKDGAAYALYRVPPELCTLLEITDSGTSIKTIQDYEKYHDQIVLIEKIPLAILIGELIHLCSEMHRFLFIKDDGYKVNPEMVEKLIPYKREMLWLANTLVPFFQEGILTRSQYPLALVRLEACLDALQIRFEFGSYTPFGYRDPRKCDPLADSDLMLEGTGGKRNGNPEKDGNQFKAVRLSYYNAEKRRYVKFWRKEIGPEVYIDEKYEEVNDEDNEEWDHMMDDEQFLSFKWAEHTGLPISEDPYEVIIEADKEEDDYFLSLNGEIFKIFKEKANMDRYIQELANELGRLDNIDFTLEEKMNLHLKHFKELRNKSFKNANQFHDSLMEIFKRIAEIVWERI